jgi:hypothetical protein
MNHTLRLQQLYGHYKHTLVHVYELSCLCSDHTVVVHTGVVHEQSCVCTDHTVVIHTGVVHGVSLVCTDHTVVVDTGVIHGLSEQTHDSS